jgi:hypothetical protein
LRDDVGASAWLRYEVYGYPTPLDEVASAAAFRSGRNATPSEDGNPRYWTESLASMAARRVAISNELASGTGSVSHSEWAPTVERERAMRRDQLASALALAADITERVLGALHAYGMQVYQELRFGAAVETAFDVVRSRVDASIAQLVPNAPPMLAAALENAASENSEHWAGAAGTCRRLLKVAADTLRPPGPPVDGHDMTDALYINRLADWIGHRQASKTARDLAKADLNYLGHRLDAINNAGSKGAHATVTREDASRFIVGTYLLLGDILALGIKEPVAGKTPPTETRHI